MHIYVVLYKSGFALSISSLRRSTVNMRGGGGIFEYHPDGVTNFFFFFFFFFWGGGGETLALGQFFTSCTFVKWDVSCIYTVLII